MRIVKDILRIIVLNTLHIVSINIHYLLLRNLKQNERSVAGIHYQVANQKIQLITLLIYE